MSDVCQTGVAAFGRKPHPLIAQKKSGGLPTTATILIFAIRAYRWTISPAQTLLFGSTGGCRFAPTCSQYALEAVRAHGAINGGWLGLKRICRCHPWGDCGRDPVPQAEFKIQNSKFKIAPESTR
ncbi:MAG: membrane protein insertion efficiency factor YidD [Verrucomicrobiia bacterium]